jgi:NhaP-type Na+/H+ or K+/H+ antiporter
MKRSSICNRGRSSVDGVPQRCSADRVPWTSALAALTGRRAKHTRTRIWRAIGNCCPPLFVLIGLEIIVLKYSSQLLMPSILVIVITLAARFVSVGAPVALLQRRFGLPLGAWKILTWGGLRGGISVALALSIPAGAERDVLVSLMYVVVIFSILAQGLTIGRVIRRAMPTNEVPASH